MNDENSLIDSLLKEHAKMKSNGEVDEQFLRELEEKIDAEVAKEAAKASEQYEKVVPMSARGWILGLGVAACVLFSYMGYQVWSDKEGEISLNSGAGDAQITAARLESDSLSSSSPGSSVSQDRVAYSPAAKAQSYAGDEKAIAGRNSLEINDLQEGFVSGSPVPASEAGEPVADSPYGDPVGGAESSMFDPSTANKRGAPTLLKQRQKILRKSSRALAVNPPSAERYGSLTENAFMTPLNEGSALSTFAIDVDTASYANLRRMIHGNSSVVADSVLIEELINYFDYDYLQPTGEHPFAVYLDSGICPWNEDNRLVRVAIQGKDVAREKRPSSNLVFLLDVSGSMSSPDKLPLLKESMKYLLEELNEKDTVSIVVYAGASGIALPATRVTSAGRKMIIEAFDKLSAGGSTAGGQGIKLAYKVAKENFTKGGINRVILATDGDFNVGVSSTEALREMLKEKAISGVYLSVLGFGSENMNDKMLETITNSGNGNYSYIDSLKEGRKVLLEDMMGTIMTIAKDVKVQLMFNPEKVKAYRLIGYSNRVLPNSAFFDKKADAGEIGAGHAVTAFYEIVPGKASDTVDLESLFKKKEMAKLELVERHADKLVLARLAYKQPDQKKHDDSRYFFTALRDEKKSLAQVDKDFQFASSVALLGMVLRDSDYRGDGDLALVEKLARQGKGNDGKGQRTEFLKLIEKLKQKE